MMFKKIITLICFLTALCFLAGTALAGMEHKTSPSLVSGFIQHPQLVYTSGPDFPPVLEVTVVLPRGLNCVWTGKADAWLVVLGPSDAEQSPQAYALTQLTGGANPLFDLNHPRQVITISDSDSEINFNSSLLYGQYQLGLVLTKAGGYPTNLGDWYSGFSGLVSVARTTITMGSENPAFGSGGSGSEVGTGLPY